MPRSGSAADVGQLLGISARRIQQLAREGVIPKAGRGRYPIAKCVQAYVKYQADLAAGAPPEDYETAKRRKMAAEARLKELEVAEQERQLVPMDVHESRLAAILSMLRAKVLNIPGKRTRRSGCGPWSVSSWSPSRRRPTTSRTRLRRHDDRCELASQWIVTEPVTRFGSPLGPG